MSKGKVYPPESRIFTDPRTGAAIRQVTDHPSIHHQPFFFIQAYDDAMRWLFFISHRTGAPQIFAEMRGQGKLIQLTDRTDLNEWSIRPAHNGRWIFFTAGVSGWRLDLESLEETELVNFATLAGTRRDAFAMREEGMVGAAMGTTNISRDDRWWVVSFKIGTESASAIVDTGIGKQARLASCNVILQRDSIGHMQFCPDDPDLLFYAGPLQDRVWLINRDGSNNRRLYARKPGEWITHETWIPGTRELAFVDWPHGIRAIQVDTGAERRVTSFNAWHPVCNGDGTRMVADTNFPDIGLQLFDPRDGVGQPQTLCYPAASSLGEHWKGSFPYEHGPIKVYAPQHTHPHPSFSPDGKYVVYTSDRTGHPQVYEATLPRAG